MTSRTDSVSQGHKWGNKTPNQSLSRFIYYRSLALSHHRWSLTKIVDVICRTRGVGLGDAEKKSILTLYNQNFIIQICLAESLIQR
jgi:hypothetical protein